MRKTSSIAELFKRKRGEISRNETSEPLKETPDETNMNTSFENRPTEEITRSMEPSTKSSTVEREPGLRKQIWEYPPGKQNEIRRAYILEGPYQPVFSPKKYKKSGTEAHCRRFQASWYDKFQSWLEYSPEKGCYILLCLFSL